MVVLVSAYKASGGQLFGFSFSHRCASVVRMSACSFCCSFTRWFGLFLFNQFLFVCFLWGLWAFGAGSGLASFSSFLNDEKFGLSPALK